MIAGLHSEDRLHEIVDPDSYAAGGDHAFASEVAGRLAYRLPALADMRLSDAWAGLYPLSPDGLPVVGPHPDRPTVVAVLGAGGSGLQSAPALGRLAAEWIVHGEPVTIPAATSLLPGRPGLSDRS
jgi:sarcosine oxidase subunit beta